MIVNYDKENGFSTIFGKLGANSSPSSDFTKAWSEISKMTIKDQPAVWQQWGQTMGYTDKQLLTFLGDVDSGKRNINEMGTIIDNTSKSTTKFSSFTAKAGSVLKSFGANLLSSFANIGTGMLAGLAISAVASGIEYLWNYNDHLIEKGEEAKQKIDDTFNDFSDTKSSIISLGSSFSDSSKEIVSTGDAIDSIAKKYTELRKGVSWSDNSNKFLSDEDYQSYLDISNQIADQFPSLVSGYDAQGNAILNLGNNASDTAVKLTELYNASMLSANVEIGNNLQDNYKGAFAQIQDYESQITAWQDQLDELNKYNLESFDFLNQSGTMEFDLNSIPKDLRQKLDNVLVDNGINRVINDAGMLQIDMSGISDDAALQLENVFSQMSGSVVSESLELQNNIKSTKLMIQDQMKSIAQSMGSYLQTSETFTGLDQNLQNAFLSNIESLDLSEVSSKYGGDINRFVYTAILNPLSQMKPEAQKTLSDLIQLDPSNMSIDEYSDAVSKALYNAFPNDIEMQDQMRKTFGFEKVAEEAEHQADALKETLGDDFSDAIDAMSLDELEKGYDLVINGDEAISTVDQLQEKIKQTQALAATAVDLNVSTQMDAIESALQSENAGTDYENAVGYLEKAKDLFDEGLIGTDDFKSIASYLSPTGSDDAVNFAENYGKALRYLTEDGKGVQNFLDDLEKKGYATMETLSDGTQNWAFDIEDLEDAASNMGIGFEFMMDMFGRLEDYGFHNNFVGSVEDGTQRIADLSTQLAQEEAKLAQLQAEGADTTAIEQQQEKVNALKNDINETSDALEQLISRSAEDYNKQINESKEAIKTLKDERQKILDEDTFGENTNLVADKLEEQIRQIAAEAGLELDAELNIKTPDKPPEIEVDTIVNKDSLDMELSKLSSGETLKFAAEVDGDFANIEALMNQDGTITFTANVDGVEQEVALVQDENGVIKFTADTTEVDAETAKTDGGTRTTDYKPDTNKVDAVNAVTDGGLRSVLYAADTSGLPTYFSPITRTVNYVAQGVSAAVNAAKAAAGLASGTMLSPAHASGTAYNMLNLKPAYAGGKVALSRDEEALVNEISQESIIRDGVWSLLPGGMHIESLKKGDIVLNANQTKALLQYGKAPGHARAYAQGSLLSSYAGGSGGGSFFIGGSGSSSGMSGRPSSSGATSNKSSSTSKSTSNSTQKAAKSVEKAADKFEESFDEIEILLDRMDRSLQNLTDSIDTYSYDLSKQSSVSDKAMNMIRTNLSTLQQAYNRYIQEANSVGLSSSWKQRVKNGAIDITTITDEDLKDKIDEYQKYYERALDAQDTIADYQSQLLDLATEKLDNIEQYFENRTEYNDNFGYLTPITDLQKALDTFSKELDKQVNDGVIKEFSSEWYDAMSSIAEMEQALIEATLKKYQDIIDNLDRISTTLDNSLELIEARGETPTESDYQRPLEVANEQIDKLYDKREQLLKKQAIYDVGSELYDDYADQIADIDDEIYGLLGDIEELKDSIWEVRWQPFFDGQEAAENLRNEMDEMRDLLDSDAFIGESGGLTETGITNVALISAAMNTAKQEVRDYQEALKRLEEDLKNNNISTNEFEETQRDLLSSLSESVGVVEDYKDSLIDMYTEMLEKENEVVQDSISKQSELLDIRKKNSDYAKSIRSQTKEINQIQAQINAIAGSTNQSSIAERKRLEAQLAELQDELRESQEDREYDIRQEGYQGLSDDLNEALDSTLNEITYNADKQEEVISNMLQNVVGMYQTAYNQINQIIANTGFTPSGDFQQAIDNLGTQQGAQNQVDASNTIAPDYTPNDYSSGINTNPIQSGSDQANNDFIQSEIEKEPNIDNRPVAQITLKPTSISLQEGKSSTIKANIRPTDAANKAVRWSSSNTKVATVSNGVVKAVKAGSAKITCTAADGSGVSASCSVTVTAKPKPTKPSGGGDGKPRVGDKVTFTGKYYYDSWGKVPAGSKYAGVKNGVVIDSYSAKKYGGNGNRTGGFDVHIKSADGKYGDLGWVKLSQISGYARGTRAVQNPIEIARVNEMGDELITRYAGNQYTFLQKGDSVVPHELTNNLFTLAEHTDEILSGVSGVDRNDQNVVVNNHYDALLKVNGNVDKDALPGLKKLLEQSYEYTSKRMYREAGLQGIHKKLR